MSKPTPIDKWIEERWPENEFCPAVDHQDYLDNSTSRQAARKTAHYILEELGVSALLKDITTNSNKFCVDPEDPRRFEVHIKHLQMQYGDLLTKLKGEKDAGKR